MQVEVTGYGFTTETQGQISTQEFDLEKIMNHESCHMSYHDVISSGTLRLMGYQYGFTKYLKLFCIQYTDGTLSLIYGLNKQHAMEFKGHTDASINFIVEVEDKHYVS